MASTQRPLESLPESRVLGTKSHPERINIVVCGAPNVGKTALLFRVSITVAMSLPHMPLSSHRYLVSSHLHRKYCEGCFPLDYIPYEDDYSRQRIFKETPYILRLTEDPGSWALEGMPALKKWVKQVDAFLFVYEVGDRRSFEKMKDIYEKLLATSDEGLNVAIGIVAAKSDIPNDEWQIEVGEGREFANGLGGVFAVCSAKVGEGVENAVDGLAAVAAEARMKLLREMEERNQELIRMDQERSQQSGKTATVMEKVRRSLRFGKR